MLVGFGTEETGADRQREEEAGRSQEEGTALCKLGIPIK